MQGVYADGRGSWSMGSLSGDFCPGGSLSGCPCPQGLHLGGFCAEDLCLGVTVQGVSVWGSLSRGGNFVQGGLCQREGSLSRRVSVLGSLSRRISVQVGVSLQRVSLQWGLSMGSLSGGFCPGGSLSGGVCPGSLSGGLTWEPLSRGSVHGVSVKGFLSSRVSIRGLCLGESLSRVGSLCKWLSVQGCLSMGSLSGRFCLRGSLSGCLCPGGLYLGGVCLGLFLQGVSVQGSMSRGEDIHPGGLCPGKRVTNLGL